MDKIEYYPDDTVRDWLDQYNLRPDVLYLPDCPFSFLEVLHEWRKRQERIKANG